MHTKPMNVIPAIDLLGGEAVRLYQGSYNNVTSYSQDPLKIAEDFEESGARYLHVVDLDAARGGNFSETRRNRRIIGRICERSGMTLEVGGGIRSEDDVRELSELGVGRLIIGSALVTHAEEVAQWTQRWKTQFIAGIDARNSIVNIAGWEQTAGIRAEELAARVASLGLQGIIYTNISRDGTLSGPDIAGSLSIARAAGLPVIISGGMGTMDDCRTIARAIKDSEHTYIEGVIIGKALYEGTINLKEAVRFFDTISGRYSERRAEETNAD